VVLGPLSVIEAERGEQSAKRSWFVVRSQSREHWAEEIAFVVHQRYLIQNLKLRI
jgi:hypothetical protein